jgi:hypothetical protein
VAVAGDVRRIVFGETGAVVATVSVSADADSDNGAAFRCTPGRGWSYDRAVQRVGAGGHVPR